jgi:hypothetical protein
MDILPGKKIVQIILCTLLHPALDEGEKLASGFGRYITT